MRDSCWLTTERLALRHFTPDDLDFLVRLYADPSVARNLGGARTRAQCQELLNGRILQYYDEHPGLGIWVTVERSTGIDVGFHVLNHIQGESIIQVGFTLASAVRGRGYATEMAEAVLRYGFVDLGLPRVAGITNLDNVASQRVLTRIGLHRGGERAFPHPADAPPGPFAWFEREAPDWLADHRSCPERPA
jgi:RimJ/RimL family protein N-acetyltransferase